jgi:8-hydroxy-5-deazaflavin:NADPH oxidoreductase
MTHPNFFDRNRRIVDAGVGLLVLVYVLAISPGAARAQSAAGNAPIKIGIIGAGNIGGTMARLWVKADHPVLLSSRHPEEIKPLADSLGALARAGTVRDALAFGDVILMAVPYGAYPQIAKDYGKDFAGKIVVDAGNAVIARDGEIAKPARENGVGLTTAKLFPGARIVRAFNILGTGRLKEMANHPGSRFAIPVAGNDQEALKVVSALVREAGFEPVIVGSLERSKLFEQGGPLYGAQMSADEMREKLKTLP